jgi:LPS sulfotransferase NodH
MEKFIILGFQRSGTSWLETMLNSHPEILCLGELFYFASGRIPFLNPRGRKTDYSYRKYVETSRRNRMMHFLNRKKAVFECLENVYSDQKNNAIGFKLMYDQAKTFSRVVSYIENKQIRVLHLVRKNVLKTMISLYSAKNRKLYHTTKQITLDKIHLPTRFLLYRMKRLG